MTPSLVIMACVVAGALAAAIVIMPLARVIPLRLQRQWREEHDANSEEISRPIVAAAFQYSLWEKAAVCILGALLVLLITWDRVLDIHSAALCFFALSLLLLATINLKHSLLPDMVVLVVLWAGLLYHALVGNSAGAVFGAAIGYGAPFALLVTIKAFTGKVFIGHGDLKTFAMAGAWLGAGAMATVFAVFVATLIALMLVTSLLRLGRLMPTGPSHLLASMAVIVGVRIA